MNPLCSVCAFRIWKISSCLRIPVAPATVQILGDLGELLDAHLLQLGDVQPLLALGVLEFEDLVGDVGLRGRLLAAVGIRDACGWA